MKRFILVLITVLLPASLLYSIGLESIDVKGGLIWIGNAPLDAEGKDSAPDPLTSIVGISLPIRFAGFFSLTPELKYFGAPYGIEYGRPVPVEIEFANWAWVMGLLLEPKAAFDFRIADTLALGAYVSPAFLFRIPARIWGEVDPAEIAAYQYGKGRFFYPGAGLIVDWEVPFDIRSPEAESLNEGEFEEDEPPRTFTIHFVVDLAVYFPLFHAWDGEGLPFYDQMMASGTAGLRFFLP